MAVRCVDYTSGADANDGIGWWKVAFTSGGTYGTSIGDTITGATSSATAVVMDMTLTSGSWAGGDMAGTFYLYGKTGTFQAENLNVGANSNVATIAGDATYNAKQTVASADTGLTATDEVYILKSQDPVNVGQNATWSSSSVTLTSAVTTVILEPEATTGWSSAQGTNVTFGTNVTKMVGSYGLSITIGTGATTGLIAYYAFGSAQDFSARQTINFWYMFSADRSADIFRLCLCSDNAGATPVDTVTFGKTEAGEYRPIAYDTGAALGANINSIGIYMDTDVSGAMSLDGIFASNAKSSSDYLGLDSLISKNSAANGGAEPWLHVKYITGTTITLDGSVNSATTTNIYALAGGSATTLYARRFVWSPTLATATTSILDSTTVSGNSTSDTHKIRGGWDSATNTQNGYTWAASQAWGNGSVFMIDTNYIELQRFGAVGGYQGIETTGISPYLNHCSSIIAGYYGIYINSSTGNVKADIDYLQGATTNPFYHVGGATSVNPTISIESALYVAGTSAASSLYIYTSGAIKIHNVTYIGTFGRPFTLRAPFIDIDNVATVVNSNTFGPRILPAIYAMVSNSTFTDNSAGGAPFENSGQVPAYAYNVTRDGSYAGADFIGEYNSPTRQYAYSPTWIVQKLDGSSGADTIWYHYTNTAIGRIDPETTTRHTASGYAWECSPLNNTYAASTHPLVYELAAVALKANEARTITLWTYRDNTAVYGKLYVPISPVLGITTAIEDTTDGNASEWVQLSISVNPTADCVLPVYFAFWGGTTYNIWIDDFGVA